MPKMQIGDRNRLWKELEAGGEPVKT